MSLKSSKERTEINEFKMSEQCANLEGIQIPQARWKLWQQLLEYQRRTNTLYQGQVATHVGDRTHTIAAFYGPLT